MNTVFKRIGTVGTLSQKIEKNIENSIRTKQLIPGQKLPTEKELGSLFGVSRTALREALRRLHARGLIEIRKGSGMFISELSSADAISNLSLYLELNFTEELILDIIKTRQLFEPQIAKMAAKNRTEEDLKQLKKIIVEMAKTSLTDVRVQGELDNKFHIQVAQSSHNPVIILIMEPIFTLLPKIRDLVYAKSTSVPDTTVKYHQAIYKSIELKDENMAVEKMKEHIRVTEKNYKSYLKELSN